MHLAKVYAVIFLLLVVGLMVLVSQQNFQQKFNETWLVSYPPESFTEHCEPVEDIYR